MGNHLTARRRQSIASGPWDAEESKVYQVFGKCHDLWGTTVEIENPRICRLDTFEERGPRSGWRVPVRRGN